MARAPISAWDEVMKNPFNTATRGILAQAIALSLAVSALPVAWSQTGSPTLRAGEPITLNFANAEIESVARTMATLTGRNLVVDPRVKGQMNLSTDRPVSGARRRSGGGGRRPVGPRRRRSPRWCG